MPAITLANLSKAFKKRPAVIDLSLEVPTGSIYGLLGHNGAGKSTTLGMLLGQVYPDAGAVTVHGHNVFTHRKQALARVGAIFESPCFYDYLSGLQNLKAFTAYSQPTPKKRLEEVLDLSGLGDRIHHPVGTYSHGMRQRLALAQALLPNPQTLLLDEPTDGLDPQGIAEFRQTIQHLNQSLNLTILFSSHLLSEVQQLCDRVAVLHQGKLVFEGDWNQQAQQAPQLDLQVDRPSEALQKLIHANLITPIEPSPITHTIQQADSIETEPLIQHPDIRPQDPSVSEPLRLTLTPHTTPAQLNAFLHAQSHTVSHLALHQPSLEDFYLQTITPPTPPTNRPTTHASTAT